MEIMTEFMEEFMVEMSRIFPKLLIQFEDFSTDKVSVLIHIISTDVDCSIISGICVP